MLLLLVVVGVLFAPAVGVVAGGGVVGGDAVGQVDFGLWCWL